MSPKTWTGIIIATALSMLIIAVAALGQKMTAWKDPKQRGLTVSADYSEVTLESDAKTTAPGTYGILLKDAHLTVGKVVSQTIGGEVTREITQWSGSRATGRLRGVWTGQAIASPDQLGMVFDEVRLGQAERELPAWVFRPKSTSDDIWAIHIHGLRSSRSSMLRSVPSAANLGMVSLVPSFYGDAENHSKGQVCHYGRLEAADVEKALGYAADHGAKAIYLFGWSMGATISLLLTETSKYRHLIAGLVLVSPGPNTEAVISENAKTAGLPRRIAALVPRILSSPLLRRLTSLTEPVDFKNLDWTRIPSRLRVPALVLHSPGDTEVPYSLSLKFADSNNNLVTLKEFPAVPHQCEWNSLPEKFEHEVESWVSTIKTAP
ncbi:alpha/beta fold hydrolase [Paeniglutamicibacter antarcticus]|uniref:Alpha/beta fold hydrolase n=1 Tax=Arthrobacter terrae TaxID=2935737 RepID=A0A931CRK2_9MICC|nr:alpha/beta fold hydrolase [Arthrobacter terrae]MBG0741125.1 alpha/beta fold hydrolase [Arthrobacter terrae]